MPANNTILPDSPLWRDELGNECMAYEPETRQPALLDGSGLDKRNAAGIRLLPDGRPMELVVESSGEDSEQSGRAGDRGRPVGRDRLQDRPPSPPTARSCAPACILAMP